MYLVILSANKDDLFIIERSIQVLLIRTKKEHLQKKGQKDYLNLI